MAHNINTYIGRQAAWHKLGIVTDKYMTTEELLSNSGFQYSVFKSQLRDGLGRPVKAWGTFRWNHDDQKAGLKDRAEFLGTVGEGYKIIQHAEGFKTIDALMRSADGAHYETAGVLGNGETVWALADLGLAVKVGDDIQHGYLLFVTSHDGTLAHRYSLCLERVVCENTLRMALSEQTKAKLVVRHTKNAQVKLDDARLALDSMAADVQKIEDKLNFLAGKKMNRESMTSIMDRLFPKKQGDNGDTMDTTRRSNIVADILKLYELNDGNAFPEQRGTAYNLLNAVTNYVDHERSTKDDQRAESALFGSGDTLKTRALELITVSAGKLEDKTSASSTSSTTSASSAPASSLGTPASKDELDFLNDLYNR